MCVPVEVVLLGVIHALELLVGNLNFHLIGHLDCCLFDDDAVCVGENRQELKMNWCKNQKEESKEEGKVQSWKICRATQSTLWR